MRNRTLFWSGAGPWFAALSLFACQPAVEKELSGAAEIESMDANSDQRLSREEHAAGARRQFLEMDANRDEVVTAAEMDATKAARGGAKAGEISSPEKIAALDADRDGRLSAAEQAEGEKALFARMDADADGFLTAEEIQKGHDAMLRKS